MLEWRVQAKEFRLYNPANGDFSEAKFKPKTMSALPFQRIIVLFNCCWSAIVLVAKQLASKRYIAIDLSLTVPHFDSFQLCIPQLLMAYDAQTLTLTLTTLIYNSARACAANFSPLVAR